MDLSDIEKIINMLQGSDIQEFVLERENSTIRICRGAGNAVPAGQLEYSPQVVPAAVTVQDGGGAAAPEVAPKEEKEEEDEGLVQVKSPIVGTFYRRPSPDADPFADLGERVKKGDKLCIVEAMKLMNEIESPASGIVEKILLTDGQVVEYGEVLFLIREN